MSSSPSSSLHCKEHLDDLPFLSCNADPCFIPDSSPPIDFLCDDADSRSIQSLLDKQHYYMPQPDYLSRLRDRSIDSTARQDAINWILEVHAFYHFRSLTAFLAVNYFDRFLSSHSLPQVSNGGGWPLELLSVACLSLAAKLEEPKVPLLLDLHLQVSGHRFVFEARTIQRMELFVTTSLNWRMRSITPFDFLHYFISNSKVTTTCLHSPYVLFSRASDLILDTTRVVDFLGYSPSILAAAAVFLSAGYSGDFPITFLDKEDMLKSCHKLMEEYMVDRCQWNRSEGPPKSPVGVLDAAACGSCDSQKSGSAEVGLSGPELVEPPSKRQRLASFDVEEQINIDKKHSSSFDTRREEGNVGYDQGNLEKGRDFSSSY